MEKSIVYGPGPTGYAKNTLTEAEESLRTVVSHCLGVLDTLEGQVNSIETALFGAVPMPVASAVGITKDDPSIENLLRAVRQRLRHVAEQVSKIEGRL